MLFIGLGGKQPLQGLHVEVILFRVAGRKLGVGLIAAHGTLGPACVTLAVWYHQPVVMRLRYLECSPQD
jgi:hypothetical protein